MLHGLLVSLVNTFTEFRLITIRTTIDVVLNKTSLDNTSRSDYVLCTRIMLRVGRSIYRGCFFGRGSRRPNERVGNKMKGLDERAFVVRFASNDTRYVCFRYLNRKCFIWRGAWSTFSVREETNTPRTICKTFSIIDRATGELFDRDLRRVGQRNRRKEWRARGEGEKKQEFDRSPPLSTIVPWLNDRYWNNPY